MSVEVLWEIEDKPDLGEIDPAASVAKLEQMLRDLGLEGKTTVILKVSRLAAINRYIPGRPSGSFDAINHVLHSHEWVVPQHREKELE